MDYKQAGVDIEAGHEVVRRIRTLARGTFTPGVLSEIGSFGGLFRLDASGVDDPVLVASADGVGTKLRVAFMAGVHRTIGVDLVNHCVNDILVQGAQPLFFLDYLATGRLEPDVAVQVVEGLATACRENGCALLGGETAEMPGFYADGEYDVAGFIVGAVPREQLIDGKQIVPGDLLIGIPSSGLHTNGYSLARRALFDSGQHRPLDRPMELDGASLLEALLVPHRCYAPALHALMEGGVLKGAAHITGGGIEGNLARILPPGVDAVIERRGWSIPPLFRIIAVVGPVSEAEMFRTFNMGVGLILAVDAADEAGALARLTGLGESAFPLGPLVPGTGRVRLD